MSTPRSIPWRPAAVVSALCLTLSACVDGGPLAPVNDAPTASSRASDRGPLERVQFVHYPRGYAKPPWAGGGGGGGGGSSTCFAFIANGARWTVAEPWEVFRGSDDGITATELLDQVGIALGSWEGAAGANLAGTGTLGASGVDLNATDGRNVVTFGNVAAWGAIAVTNVWGYFRGPQSSRQIIEWDMIFDDVDFGWSLDGSAGTMDVLNIAAHEVGHALGMGHPESSCTEETMFGYAATGETKKRTLNTGDIAGIIDLY